MGAPSGYGEAERRHGWPADGMPVEVAVSLARQQGAQHLLRLLAERGQGLMPVVERPEVNLPDRLGAVFEGQVQKQADLHPVVDLEDCVFCGIASDGALPGEGLAHPGKLGSEEPEGGLGGKLGDAATFAGTSVQTSIKCSLDEDDLRIDEQGLDKTPHSVQGEGGEVGVQPDNDVSPGDEERSPEHIAFALGGSPRVGDAVRIEDGCSRGACDLRGAIT